MKFFDEEMQIDRFLQKPFVLNGGTRRKGRCRFCKNAFIRRADIRKMANFNLVKRIGCTPVKFRNAWIDRRHSKNMSEYSMRWSALQSGSSLI